MLDTDYATAFSLSIDVQAGDILVVSHANNKRDNGNNTISATTAGVTYTALGAGDSGDQSGAWLFYSTAFAAAATVDITLDTSNGTKTNSTISAYYVLRAGAGESISLVESQTDVGPGFTGSITFADANSTGAFGVLAQGLRNNATILTDPVGWTEDNQNNNKRSLYSSATVSNPSPSFDYDNEDNYAIVGATFTTTAVPEPSSAALFGLGGLALIFRRRK